MQLSPPPTPAEALAHAQLLLDFPPAAEKLDEWRATIRSLVLVANKDDSRPAGPSGRRSIEPPHASGGRTGGAAATLHSPPPCQLPPVPVRRGDACDNISIASSDPRTHRDQCQVLRERAHEDAQTTIERQREARHRSNRRVGPTMDYPTPGALAVHPMRWVAHPLPVSGGSSSSPPTARSSLTLARSTAAKPTHRSSSASTPSRCKLLVLATTRCLPITPRWHLNPMSSHG